MKVVLKDVSIRDCRVNGPRVELVVKNTIHASDPQGAIGVRHDPGVGVQGGALFLKSARGNIYVDDALRVMWDLNWRAGSNQACFGAIFVKWCAGRPVHRLFWQNGGRSGLCGNQTGLLEQYDLGDDAVLRRLHAVERPTSHDVVSGVFSMALKTMHSDRGE